MKTAISIGDKLLRDADETARRMGLNRSRFFALAVASFLRQQRSDEMLRRLNEVYADSSLAPQDRLLKGIKAKVRHTIKDRW